MRRSVLIAGLAVLAGCGSSAIQGTASWVGAPRVAGHTLSGELRNTTGHSLGLDVKSMRLLDDHGRKVAARIRVGSASVAAHGTTSVRATWRSGKPVRIDYGEGTLALPPG